MSNEFAEDLARKGIGPTNEFAEDLAAKGGNKLTPERRAKLQAGIERQRAKVAALNAEPDPMSLGEIARNVVPTTAALADRFNNALSVGGWRAATRAFAPGEAEEQERRAQLLNNPVGKIAGLAMDVSGGGMGVPGALYQGVAAPLTQTIANPLLRAATRGAVGGGLAAGAEAAVEQAPFKEQAKRAALGAGIGAAADVIPTGLVAAEEAIQGGVGGQARRLIERYGGRVSPTTSGEGGAFDQELAGLPATERSIGEASQRSAERVLETTDRLHQERVARPYRAAKATIDAGPGRRGVPINDVYQAMMEVYQSPRLTMGQKATVRAELDNLERLYYHRQGPLTGQLVMTENQLNDYKTMLNNLSKAGQAGTHTIPQNELGNVAAVVRAKVDQGPYAELNARYAEGAEERSDVRRAFQLGPRESTNEIADANKVRNVIGRQTQDTTTAGATTMDLPEIRERYPELERDLDMPELLAAKSDLTFRTGAPRHGGLIARLPPGLGLGATAGLAMTGNHGYSALLPVAAEFAARNSAPIAGRFLYTPAGEAGLMGRAGQNLLSQLAIRKKLEEAESAKRLKSRMKQ